MCVCVCYRMRRDAISFLVLKTSHEYNRRGKNVFIHFAYRIGWPDVSEIIYGSPFCPPFIRSLQKQRTNDTEQECRCDMPLRAARA